MKSRVHPKYKTKCRVSNWADYDRALVQRGGIMDFPPWSLTVIATLEEFNDMDSMEVLLWQNGFEGCG